MKKLTLIALASVFSFGVLAHEGGAPEGGVPGGATPPAAAPTGGDELAKGKTAPKPAPKKTETPKKHTK